MAEKTILRELSELVTNLISSDKINKEEVIGIMYAEINKIQSASGINPNKADFKGEFVAGILDSIPDPVFIKDEQHRWVMLNDACCKMFGYERTYLIGKSDYDFFPAEEADVYWKVDDLVFTSGEEILNEEFQTNPVTGVKKILATKKTLFTDSDGNKFIVGVIRDITGQKQAEADLKAVTETKEKLFSILAHDIKDPFNSLIGFSGLLKKNYYSYDDEKRLKFINIIDKANRENLMFVENILAWTAGQMDKIENNPVFVNLNDVIDRCVEIFISPISFKEINLIVGKQPENPDVFADIFMLKTIIRNLLSNAVKFTSKAGTIEINYSCLPDGNVLLKIKDSGAGMTSAQKENLSKTAFCSTPGTEGETGVGLGLKLCYEFALKCGCELSFDSEYGKGTEFRLLLKTSI
jgi:PAS domain S-box-containing protein